MLNRDSEWRVKAANAKRKTAEQFISYRQSALVSCPICGEKKSQQFIEVYGYEYAQCSRCMHLFMQPPVDTAHIKKLYQGKAGGSSQALVYLNNERIFEKRVLLIATPKVIYCNEFIKKKGLWVDIGCGVGEVLTAAKRTGWSVLGYESDIAEVDFARAHGLEIIAGDITADTLGGLKGAQVVSLINILEHIADPVTLLKDIVAALPKDSHLIIEVPRHPSLSSFVNLVFPSLAYRHIHSPEHLHIFSESSLGTMLSVVGATPVALWEFGQDVMDFVFHAMANAQVKEDEFTHAILRLAVPMQKVVDEKSMSDTLFVIAKKN